MKRYAMFFCLLATAPSSWAASCVSGTLAQYFALGPSGCTIGSDTFTGFQQLSPTSGASLISGTDINVTPSGTTATPTLTFNFDSSSTKGQVSESLFVYKIAGSGLIGSSIALSGTTIAGDGAVNGLQNLCEGGTFGPDHVSGCNGHGDSLGTVATAQPTDSATFAPSTFINVTDDITTDGGLSGSAAGGTFVNRFTAAGSTATPEPGTTLLLSSAACIFLCLKRRSAMATSEVDRGDL